MSALDMGWEEVGEVGEQNKYQARHYGLCAVYIPTGVPTIYSFTMLLPIAQGFD